MPAAAASERVRVVVSRVVRVHLARCIARVVTHIASARALPFDGSFALRVVGVGVDRARARVTSRRHYALVNVRVDVVVVGARAARASRLEHHHRALAREIVRGTRVVDVRGDARVRVPIR